MVYIRLQSICKDMYTENYTIGLHIKVEWARGFIGFKD